MAPATCTSPTKVNERIDEFSSGGSFTKAWGWGVSDGGSSFETCTSSCQAGLVGGGAGQLDSPLASPPMAPATSTSATTFNNRIDEFSSSGSFTKAWGWGVSDGGSSFETCTSSCQAGLAGGGAGQLDDHPVVATDGSGNVYVADHATHGSMSSPPAAASSRPGAGA